VPFHGQASLVHSAVLWRRIGTDANAQPVVADEPETVPCRWEEGRREVPGPDGGMVSVDATVVLDRPVTPGSVMWKGTTDDLPGTGQTPVLDVFEVVTYEGVPDWRGADTTHEATLARRGNRLPSVGAEPEG
jgi:hypothetical protein